MTYLLNVKDRLRRLAGDFLPIFVFALFPSVIGAEGEIFKHLFFFIIEVWFSQTMFLNLEKLSSFLSQGRHKRRGRLSSFGSLSPKTVSARANSFTLALWYIFFVCFGSYTPQQSRHIHSVFANVFLYTFFGVSFLCAIAHLPR